MRGMSHQWTGCHYIVICLALVATSPVLAADESAKNVASSDPVFTDAAIEFFEKEVRPVLTNRCLECHGNGKDDPKGGLSLKSRHAALKGGDTGPAVLPGKVKESLLVSAIEYGDLYQMPPKSKLPAAEIAILKKWVELGAPWPKEAASAAGTVKPFDLVARKSEHWCWKPITDPAVPAVKYADWPLTSVDHFILAKLESSGLKPASAAERYSLLRRVYFDLVGLPPSPEEVAAFINDNSPQALEHVVDRLLNSVHFGERWARHWLDLVRYAETRGHEFEPIIPNAWQYRDYVIRALNADVPYGKFLTEHLAGDLMPPRWRETPAGEGKPSTRINEAVLGTGFWFLGEEVHSPVDIRKDETDRMDNRLDVMSKTFLGLTVGCARCHDHKFDAISQRDYYALTGYLISGSYRQVRLETEQQDRQIAAEVQKARAAAKQAFSAHFAKSSGPAVSKLDQYLLTARQLVNDGITTEEVKPAGPTAEVVFADFEGDTWNGWKTEGTAFGDRPPRKGDNAYEAPLEGFKGERLVNSHRNAIQGPNNAGTRDAQTGKLTSPEFTIQHNTIRFLIGGGAHAGKTCMNLEVDGKSVRTATGQNSGMLRSEQWVVSDLRGKTARITIVDSEAGGWGHILVDQIVFTNDVSSPRPAIRRELAAAAKTKVEAVATSKGLHPEILAEWCVELAATQKDHPLHGFMKPPEATPASAVTTTTAEIPGLVVDFGHPQPGTAIQDGVSFGPQPAQTGELRFTSQTGGPRVLTQGGWERDLFWKDQKLAPGTQDDHGGMGDWHRHGRMVRSPEFSMNSGRLWYLVRGSVRAYAVVNSHLVVAGPLHGSLLRDFKHADDQWHWVAHGLELYKGHRLHVEFSPGDDNGCCVAMVVQSDDAPKLPDLSIHSPFTSATDSDEKRAVALRDQFAVAVSILAAAHRKPITASDAALANWILDHQGLILARNDRMGLEKIESTLRNEESQLAKQVQWESQLAPAMLDGNGIDEHLLIRGNSNTPRDSVARRFLEAITGEKLTNPVETSGRMELAQQMLQSPLAARVAVNRIWHHLFGRGIVPSVDNMGVLGQAPTHPELLDHLATQFVKQGWSTKKLIKSLILSRTYQMSSHPSEPAETQDPDNLLWHRMPIKRLQGEIIRDSLLAVSGRLVPTPFGPSVPIHLTPFMEGRGRPGVNGPLDGNGRRSIYIAVRRNFLSPMMLAFDTPSPFSTVGRRTNSNVPAQALILMNDPFVVEMARKWAERLLADPGQSIEQRIDAMYLTAFSRRASDAEKSEASAFLEAQGARFGIADQQRKVSPQAWADLCHVLFNVKEFVFVE